jgi:putative colanic acid biosynthesis glycosyltransferase
MIKLSIITVTYNDLRGLIRTIESLDSLVITCDDEIQIEHVIIDGDSFDGTQDYIGSIVPTRAVFTKFISESDEGIYDAMNKGVIESEGQFVVFLNAGDEISSDLNVVGLLVHLEESMQKSNEAGLALSSIIKFYNKNFTIKSRAIKNDSPRMPTVHQSMIYKRAILLKYKFDVSYRVCGDYDNFSQLYKSGMMFRPINDVFSVFYAGGVSSTSPLTLFRESSSITRRYYNLSFTRRFLSKMLLAFSLVRFQILFMVYMSHDDYL